MIVLAILLAGPVEATVDAEFGVVVRGKAPSKEEFVTIRFQGIDRRADLEWGRFFDEPSGEIRIRRVPIENRRFVHREPFAAFERVRVRVELPEPVVLELCAARLHPATAALERERRSGLEDRRRLARLGREDLVGPRVPEPREIERVFEAEQALVLIEKARTVLRGTPRTRRKGAEALRKAWAGGGTLSRFLEQVEEAAAGRADLEEVDAWGKTLESTARFLPFRE